MQQALIVDDSKTARVALRKMLDRCSIPSTMVESAEQALEYLKHNHPDIIFMDHMMPGMDGFAAVKAIKADPQKSSIPIVMHTTKQGDIYVGQARALGASDILSKPASDEDLQAVLDRVQRNSGQSAAKAATIEMPIITEADISEAGASETNIRNTQPMAAITAELESDAIAQQSSAPFFGTFRQWLLLLIWLVPALWLLASYLPLQNQVQQYQRQQLALIKVVEWAVNWQDSYDYGELPMSGNRLALLKGLVSKLGANGFTGTIRLEGHVGEFCLTEVPLEDGSEIVMLPKPELPVSACTMIGTSTAVAMEQSIAQSDAFREYVKAEGLLDEDSAIRIELVPRAATSPRYAYPAGLEGISTGDWNAVALNNNRVQFILLPD